MRNMIDKAIIERMKNIIDEVYKSFIFERCLKYESIEKDAKIINNWFEESNLTEDVKHLVESFMDTLEYILSLPETESVQFADSDELNFFYEAIKVSQRNEYDYIKLNPNIDFYNLCLSVARIESNSSDEKDERLLNWINEL